MACPRLDVWTPEPGTDAGVPSILSPVIAAFKSANGMFRFFETFTAATNCPKFLNPEVAPFRSVPTGSVVFTRLRMFDFVDSFCATGLFGVHTGSLGPGEKGPVVGVDVVVDVEEVDDPLCEGPFAIAALAD